MRPIDADALKKRIARITCVGGWSKGILMQFVDEEPTIEINQWIPCSERLPEDDAMCIVQYQVYREEDGDTWIGWHEMDNVWYIDGEEHSQERGHEVIAWMPLPKPWKGVDDE